MFARAMKLSAAVFGALAAVCIALYRNMGGGVALSLSVTFCTCFYHFAMRLAAGTAIDAVLGNRADYDKPWFQPRAWEAKLYRTLKVKEWKGRMPSYAPELFSVENHSLEEIAMAMCQAELVHEACALLSFVPLIAARWFDDFGVFFITSAFAACVDLAFIIMQRYNRPRVLKLARISAKPGAEQGKAHAG